MDPVVKCDVSMRLKVKVKRENCTVVEISDHHHCRGDGIKIVCLGWGGIDFLPPSPPSPFIHSFIPLQGGSRGCGEKALRLGWLEWGYKPVSWWISLKVKRV